MAKENEKETIRSFDAERYKAMEAIVTEFRLKNAFEKDESVCHSGSCAPAQFNACDRLMLVRVSERKRGGGGSVHLCLIKKRAVSSVFFNLPNQTPKSNDNGLLCSVTKVMLNASLALHINSILFLDDA